MMNNFDPNQPSFQPSAPLNPQQSQQALDTEATLSDQSDAEKERKKNLSKKRIFWAVVGVDIALVAVLIYGIIDLFLA